MHGIAAKFGAFAFAPFLLFGGHGAQHHADQSYRWPWTPAHASSTDSGDRNARLSITDVDGPAALGVSEEGTWTLDVKSRGDDSLSYSVKWGDEGAAAARTLAAESVQSSATFSHEYEAAGTYHPEFTVTDADGRSASKTATVVVGDEELAISSIDPASAAAGATAAITGTGLADGDTVTFGGRDVGTTTLEEDGTLSFVVPDLKTGAYNVRVHDGDRRSNAVSFTIVAASPKLSVTGIDAPVKLAAGEDGTWTVHASTSGDSLHYSVVWGDEGVMTLMRAAEMTDSSGTFSHAYAKAGTYHPKFTVSDDDGHTASASASVVVK
jgi:PKD repeat protein